MPRPAKPIPPEPVTEATAFVENLPPVIDVRIDNDAARTLVRSAERIHVEPRRLADLLLSMAVGTLPKLADAELPAAANAALRDIGPNSMVIQISRDVWLETVQRLGARPVSIGLVLSATIARYASAIGTLPPIRARDISVLR